MRPRGGVLECIKCSDSGRARLVLAKGKQIHLGKGQAALGVRGDSAGAANGGHKNGRGAVEGPLQPRAPEWRPPRSTGEPHPQLGLFPYDTVRDGQRRFARDVTMAIQGRRHLVANAPTGIGKTAASLAPALQYALENGKTVMFLTSRQSQHHIAVETLRQIQAKRGARFTLVDLVSKRDMCLRPEAAEMHAARFPDFCATETRTKSCQYLGTPDRATLDRVARGVLHVEELMQVSKEAGLCPHIVAMAAAKKAQVVIADYNHLFSDIREQSLERLGLQLSDLIVIVDEAHNLPDRIRQNHAHRVTDFLLDQVQGEARAHRHKDILADLDALRKALRLLADDAARSGKAEAARFGDGDAQVAPLEIQDLHDAFTEARNKGTLGLARTLQDVIEELRPLAAKVRKGQDDQVYSEELMEALDDWGRFRGGGLRFMEWDEAGGLQLHIRLLDPSVPARQVFDAVHTAILMSGTLRPPEMARDVLGLDADRTTVRSYGSPFPPENRMVCVAQGISTRYKDRGPELYERLATAVADTCDAAEGNVAVFAPSYQILRDVLAALPQVRKEIIEEEPGMGKRERDQVLDRLRGAHGRHGALLAGVLGGSFSEGVDYNDNLLVAIIVVGLPLAPPDLEVKATIAYYQRKYPGRGQAYGYDYPAMNKVLQAMGRGIRSETDRCAVLLLDERYMQPKYRQVLPQDAPIVPSSDPVFTVQSFLAAHGL